MSLADTVFGRPAQTSYTTTAGTRSPGYDFAHNFFGSLQSITANPFPTFQGKIDPGLSPTLTDLIQRAQGYAASSPPSILQGAAGTFGRLMNPQLRNPVTRIFGGSSDFTGRINPNQKVFGGGTTGQLAFPGSLTNFNGGGYQSGPMGGGMDGMMSMNGGGYQSGPMGPNVMTPTNGGGYQSGGPQSMQYNMPPMQNQQGWQSQQMNQQMMPSLTELLSYLSQGQQGA